jgi:predicted transcriptional regulator of viral defense system
MEMNVFFARHPVFRIEELDTFLRARHMSLKGGEVDSEKRQALLNYHQEQGHILRLRKGLYATVPPGSEAKEYPVDSFLIAARITPDAVLAYQTALSFLGVAHSITHAFVSLSEQLHTRSFSYRNTIFRAIPPPTTLPRPDAMRTGVEARNRQGLDIRVTGWERTLVDALDRLSLVGGWNEAWRSLETMEVYLNLDFLIDYALSLQEEATCAKVGCFLQAHADRFAVKPRHLDRLKAKRPRQPYYIERNRNVSLRNDRFRRFVPEWNLWLPVERTEYDSQGMSFVEETQV